MCPKIGQSRSVTVRIRDIARIYAEMLHDLFWRYDFSIVKDTKTKTGLKMVYVKKEKKTN